MKKRKFIIVIAIVVLMATISTLLFLLPRTTKIDYTLNTTRFNAQGEQTGDIQISVHGQQKKALFRDPQIELSVEPFDRLAWLKVITADEEASPYRHEDLQFFFYSAADWTGKVVMVTVGFDANMDSWIFVNHTRQVYYVASVSGKYSPQELVEYFRVLIPVNW